MKFGYVACDNCDWIHFNVTKEYCQTFSEDFKIGTTCVKCRGSYKSFHDVSADQVPLLCNVLPILNRSEDID